MCHLGACVVLEGLAEAMGVGAGATGLAGSRAGVEDISAGGDPGTAKSAVGVLGGERTSMSSGGVA